MLTKDILTAVANGQMAPEQGADKAGDYFDYSYECAANPSEFDAWQRVMRIIKARRAGASFKPVQPAVTVRADCGHDVARISLMSASLGSSCTDCYDRMSGEE